MKTNYEIRYASNPKDAKKYDTSRLREEHLIKELFTADDQLNTVYSLYDRFVIGGAKPVNEVLQLESIDPLKSDYFLSRREIGIFNIGGTGIITVDGVAYKMEYKEALYIGAGNRVVTFESENSGNPAMFYFNSAPAHKTFPDCKVTKSDAIIMELGSQEFSNHRNLNKMLVNQVIETCQLQMGMTELKSGSVWNSMPAHTHTRRMEVYFYFDIQDGNAICHFMGEPTETRHIWMTDKQAVISPAWSIHSAAGTSNYTFIWGMAGENLDFSDQDIIRNIDLR
jgi:4-deoxy-L-threo-5-hexosulose-uronate ketol-isomerase